MAQSNRAVGGFLVAVLGLWGVGAGAVAGPSVERKPEIVTAGERVTVRAVGFSGGAQIRWRWNEKLRAERVDGAQVVLVALDAGEGMVVATGSAAGKDQEAESRFEIQSKGAMGAAKSEGQPQKAEDGAAESAVVEKHPNGKKAAEGRMKDGERDGAWTFWNEEGVKVGEGAYRAGKRHGDWKEWNDKGRLVTEVVFDEGREVRTTETIWNDDGTRMQAETVIREGDRKIREKTEWGWHSPERMMGEKHFRDGKRDGEWKVWDEEGKLAMRVVFTNGWALPPAEALSEPAARKAGEVYLAVIARGTMESAQATSLATGLSKEEQEALSLVAFKCLEMMDEGETEKFEQLYRLVIEACPGTDRAHEAHWRLTNMYRQAFDPPQHQKIVALLEGFLARYKESKVVSMQKYPDEMLVFSPLRSLHQSYEALGQWDKIAAYYEKAVAANAAMKPEDHWDYAQALDKLGRKASAIEWYEKFLKVETDKDSFMVEVARDRVKELKGQ